MSGKRRQYTEEFKESGVKRITEQGYQLSEAARNLGIDPSVLRRWKSAAGSEKNIASAPVTKDLLAEAARLIKENTRLKLEREILKKATVFFAKESGNDID